jgi:hypothetical protein
MRGLHLRDASLILRDEAFDKPIIAGHGASLLPFPTPGRSVTRWIQAKLSTHSNQIKPAKEGPQPRAKVRKRNYRYK